MNTSAQPSQPTRMEALHTLLLQMFSYDTFRTWLTLGRDANIVPFLPGDSIGFASFVSSAIVKLEQDGRIDDDFFLRLTQARPFRATDLAEVAAMWKNGHLPQDAPTPTPTPPRRLDFYRHISLPPRYVSRRAEEQRLIDAAVVRGDGTHPPAASPRLIGLHGMPGSGKSSLARAICEHPELQAAFPDGILWATLGRTPDVNTRLREWIQALGGSPHAQVPSLDSLKSTLAELLRGRAILMILDDVWQHASAEIFRVGPPTCTLLLSTVDDQVIRELGGEILTTPPMTGPEALTVLQSWAVRQFSPEEHVLTVDIAGRLGYHPLALKLAGAQLRTASADKWLENFHVHKLRAARPETLHDDLAATFERSLQPLDGEFRRAYVQLSVFPIGELVPFPAIYRLWSNVGEWQARERLDDLASRALLDVVGVNRDAILLHSLLHHLTTSELGRDTADVHSSLLSAYRLSGADWGDVPDDGYLYDHLAYHLRGSGRIDELVRVVLSRSWFAARLAQSRQVYEPYLNDVLTAWREIHAGCADERSLAACLKCALVIGSVHKTTRLYTPNMIARAFELGVWSAKRALSIASGLSFPQDRGRAAASLLQTRLLDAEQTRDALEIATEAIHTLLSNLYPQFPADILAAILPFSRVDSIAPLFATSFATSCEKIPRAIVDLFRVFWPYLKPSVAQLRSALDAVLRIEDEEDRVQAVVDLSPLLAKRNELVARTMEAADAANGPYLRVRVRVALASILHQQGSKKFGADTLENLFVDILELPGFDRFDQQTTSNGILEVGDIWVYSPRISLLLAVMPVLPEQRRELARAFILDDVLSLPTNLERGETPQAAGIAAAAAVLTDLQVLDVLGAAVAISEPLAKTRSLSALIPRLTGEARSRAVTCGLETLDAATDDSDWGICLFYLFPHVDDRFIETHHDRIMALSDFLRSAILQNWGHRFSVASVRRTMAVLAQGGAGNAELIGRMDQLIRFAEPESLKKCLEGVAVARDDWPLYAHTLAGLVPYLTGEVRARAVRQGLNAAVWLRSPHALTAFVPHLAREQVELVLEAIPALPDLAYGWGFSGGGMVIAHPSHAWSPQAYTLDALVPGLEGALVEKGFSVALALRLMSGPLRPNVMATLASKVTASLEQCVELVPEFARLEDRASVLLALASRFDRDRSEKFLQDAEDATMSAGDVDRRITLLAELATRREGSKKQELLQRCTSLLFEASAETLSDVIDRIAPQLDDESRRQLLHTVSTLPSQETDPFNPRGNRRASALAAIAPYLRSEDLIDSLQVFLDVPDERSGNARLHMLLQLLSRLTGREHERVLTLCMEMPRAANDDESRARRLVMLASHVTGPTRETCLGIVRTLGADWRAWAMKKYIDEMSPHEGLVQETRIAIAESLKNRHWCDRKGVLNFMHHYTLLVPPLFSASSLEEIAIGLMELFEDRVW